MVLYEALPSIPLAVDNLLLHPNSLPELVHLDDPALDVLVDFKRIPPLTIQPNDPIDDALNEMKLRGAHLLIVVNPNQQVIGLISSEDILGEKPIKVMQERRLRRSEVLVRMVMTPQAKISAIDFASLRHAKVASIINTLKELQQHYMLVVNIDEASNKQTVRGLFSSSQISKQLHMDISSSLTEAHSLAELQKRHKE